MYNRPLRLQDHEIDEARRLLADLRGLANPRPAFLYDRYLAGAIEDLDFAIRDYERRLPSPGQHLNRNGQLITLCGIPFASLSAKHPVYDYKDGFDPNGPRSCLLCGTEARALADPI